MNRDQSHEIHSTRQRMLDTLFADQPYVAAPIRTMTMDEPRPYIEQHEDRFVAHPNSLIHDDVLRQLIEGRSSLAAASAPVGELHEESWWLESIATAPLMATEPPAHAWIEEVRHSGPASPVVQLQQLDIFTVQEAAKYLRLGQATLRGLIRREEVPFARIGRRVLFRRVALLDWLAGREHHAV